MIQNTTLKTTLAVTYSLITILLAILLVTSISTAVVYSQYTNEKGLYADGFEDGDVSEYSFDSASSDVGTWTLGTATNQSLRGDYTFYSRVTDPDGDSGIAGVWFVLDDSLNLNNDSFTVSYETYQHSSTGHCVGHRIRIIDGDGTGFMDFEHDCTIWDISGNYGSSGTIDDGFFYQSPIEWRNVTYEVNTSTDTLSVTLKREGSSTATTSGALTGFFDDTSNLTVKIQHYKRSGGYGELWLDNIEIKSGNYVPTQPVSGIVTDENGNPIENVTISSNKTSDTTQTGPNGEYTINLEEQTTHKLTAVKNGYSNGSQVITVQTSPLNNIDFSLTKTQLELDINPFMEHGSKQIFQVFWTNESGRYDVTDSSTVISNNTNVITVNTAANKLIATNNRSINKRIIVNASYNSATIEKNVTVANRTLDNIAIMPASQWLASVLGFDESGTWYVFGSEIQWIFMAIFIGAAAAWRARNEWLGIGTIIGALILFWTLEYVSLGIMLVAVFYGIFAAYQLKGIPGRSDTNVGDGL